LLSGAVVLSFDQHKLTPQFGTMLIDLIARFAALERCEQRVCKIFPSDPQQFLQPVYIASQNFQIRSFALPSK
jgi:hypothetical protein